MKARALVEKDLGEIRDLHQKYFYDFEFPHFFELLCGFVVEDDDGSIVIAGGVELIGEALLITNKEKSRIKVGKSLVVAHRVSDYICRKFNIRELHAFVTDEDYAKHLIKHGFERRDEPIVLRQRIYGKKE